jgi:hypothetical protein
MGNRVWPASRSEVVQTSRCWWKLNGTLTKLDWYSVSWGDEDVVVMAKLMAMTFLVLITMDETEIYNLYWCCGCSVGERFGVMISTWWAIT